MTTSSVVAALILHNQSCAPCRMGEPCVVTERIQDEWLRRQAATTLLEPGTAYMALEENAA